MDFALDTIYGNKIEIYKTGLVQINGKKYPENLLLTANLLIENYLPNSFQDLEEKHISLILKQSPKIILIGNGNIEANPNDYRMISYFTSKQIGVDIMKNSAACRTYNILNSEQRQVILLLFPIQE